MGFFTKSFIILLVALGTPLAYRQFVDQNTVNYLNTKITNFKVVDDFLRQSANNFDKAHSYVEKSELLNKVISQAKPHLEPLIKNIQDKINSLTTSNNPTQKPISKPKTAENVKQTNDEQTTTKQISQNQGVKRDPHVNHSTNKGQKPPQKQRAVECSRDKPAASLLLFTKEELSNPGNGKVYLSLMGSIYDVTSGKESYYGTGKSYEAFAGKDGTRAYLTGNFTHDIKETLEGLDEGLYKELKNWEDFYTKTYPLLGRLIGQYYDSTGCPSVELLRVRKVFDKLKAEDDEREKQDVMLPECNSEFNGDTKKSKVWCTKASGGVQRDWVGVPRLYTNPADGSKRCVCLDQGANLDKSNLNNLSEYQNCQPTSSECNL